MGPEATAVILAGGQGKRLRPYTLTIPKPLLPLAGTPIIEIVVRQLSRARFQRIVVSLGYMGEMVEYVLGDGSRFGVQIEYVREASPMGTAGSLALIDGLPEHLLVMNGDLLTTFDYRELLTKTINEGSVAGVALHGRRVEVDYGVVDVDFDGRLVGYREKPSLELLVSMGIYVVSRSAVEMLDGQYCDMPTLLQRLVQQTGGVTTYVTDCYWQDIGRLDDFEQAGRDFEADPNFFLGNS